MSQYRRALGNAGEQAALELLLKKGYKKRESNWKSAIGEIDLIVEKKDLVIFVEVKTRYDFSYGHAAESITRKKQMRIAKTAASYIKACMLFNRQFRFDVVAIMDDGIEHIEDAFSTEGFTI